MKIKQVVEKEFVHVEELIEASGEGLWKMYPDGEVIFYNKEFYKMIDIDTNKAMIDDWLNLVHPDDLNMFSKNLTDHINGDLSRFISQYRIKSKSGDYLWIEAKAATRYDENGHFLYMVGSHMNITQRKEYETIVHDLAYKDQLTGLYNRQKLSEMMRTSECSYRILYMNLSKFRMINDTYGYEAANRVLKLFAEALLAVFDSPEHVFRVDADEFAIVLVGGYSDDNIKKLIKNFTLGFKELIYSFINGLDINLYMGLSLLSEGSDDNLLEQAKWAGLYAKRKELDHCVIYNEEIKEETERALFMELGIRKGLKTDEFFMVFQPIYKKGGHAIAFYESLMRWDSKEYGRISPDEFIPVAEKTGDIVDLGYFAIKHSVEMLKFLHEELKHEVPMSINLSVIQLLDNQFVKNACQMIDEAGISRRWVIFEITESFALESNQVARNALNELNRQGFQVALDDFGSGYSSMTILLQLMFDKLKIDKELIWRAHQDKEVETFIKALTYLCHSKGIEVVGEGIETIHMSQNCQNMGIDYEQGYYYSKPLGQREIFEQFIN